MNLEDWTKFGGGFQGEGFFHKTNPGVVLKLFSENINKEYVEKEFNLSVAIKNAGIKCPEALEIVQVGSRYGIIFRRVLNKRSFCRLSGEHPEMIDTLAERLAKMLLDLQSKSSEGLPFPSAIQMYQEALDNNTVLDAHKKELCQKALDEIATEDVPFLIHGDFHFGNAITDGQEDFFIDLGNLAHGNPKFDIAMFYLVTHFSLVQHLEVEFHVTVDQAMEFWNAFKKYYYGRELSDEEIFASIKNYIIARMIWVMQDTGNAPFSVAGINLVLQENCPCASRDYI